MTKRRTTYQDPALPKAKPQDGTQRVTKPGGYNPFSLGGVQIIPRRQDLRNGLYTPQVGTADQMAAAAYANPLRVLGLLADVDPLVAKNQGNVLALTCAPGDVQFVADKPTSEGAGDDTVDPAGTALIKALWESLPQEVGGLKGLRKALTLSAKSTGMMVIECVPGPHGGGVAQIWPVDPLTLVFKRNLDTGLAQLYQRQGAEDVLLDDRFVFYVSCDAAVDNPYGRPKDAAVLPIALAHMAFRQDLRDAVHNSAWKRLVYKYSLERLYTIAKDILKLADDDIDPVTGEETHPAADWVNGQLAQVQTFIANLNPDDNLTADSAGGAEYIGGADLGGVEPVLDAERLSLIQALGDSPTMMGVDGPSFNFGSVAWAVQAQLLEDLRDDVLGLLTRAVNLHLRLLGQALTARAVVQPIRTTDALVDEQTRAFKINNEFLMVDAGYITDEQASIKLTGSGCADPKKAAAGPRAAANAPTAKKGAPDDAPVPGSGGGSPLPAGSTQEERKATKPGAKADVRLATNADGSDDPHADLRAQASADAWALIGRDPNTGLWVREVTIVEGAE